MKTRGDINYKDDYLVYGEDRKCLRK